MGDKNRVRDRRAAMESVSEILEELQDYGFRWVNRGDQHHGVWRWLLSSNQDWATWLFDASVMEDGPAYPEGSPPLCYVEFDLGVERDGMFKRRLYGEMKVLGWHAVASAVRHGLEALKSEGLEIPFKELLNARDWDEYPRQYPEDEVERLLRGQLE